MRGGPTLSGKTNSESWKFPQELLSSWGESEKDENLLQVRLSKQRSSFTHLANWLSWACYYMIKKYSLKFPVVKESVKKVGRPCLYCCQVVPALLHTDWQEQRLKCPTHTHMHAHTLTQTKTETEKVRCLLLDWGENRKTYHTHTIHLKPTFSSIFEFPSACQVLQ